MTLLIAANWKMNPPPAGFDAADSPYLPTTGIDVLICPMAVDLRRCVAAGLHVAAQAARPEQTGAFTGDLSVSSAKDAGCRAMLCGHSERRQYHGETDADVRAQTDAALAAGLMPIVCVGEKDGEDREAVLRRQLDGIPNRPEVVLAYEPVWAIGTGKAASAADAALAATLIRQILPNVSAILYGGSAKADNAAAFLAESAIGGLLVGGAALKPSEFSAIVSVAKGLGR